MWRSLFAGCVAGRRIERKRTRTGPKQLPVNRDRFPLSLSTAPSIFRRASVSVLSIVLPVVRHCSLPLLWSRKTLQCEMPSPRRTFRLAPSFHSSLISLFLSLYLSRDCARAFFFVFFLFFFFIRSPLPLSLIAPTPLQLSARGSFQLVPAETFHRPRPPFSAFFPSGFSRLLELSSRV